MKQSLLSQKRNANFGGKFTVEVYASFEEVSSSQIDWDNCVADTGSDVFLTYDWCRIWWQHYGMNRLLRIFILRAEDTVIGILPFFIDQYCLWPVTMRIAKMIGAEHTGFLCNLPIHSEWVSKTWVRAQQILMGEEGCHAILIGPLSDCHAVTSKIRQRCEKESTGYVVFWERVVDSHCVVSIPSSCEEYVSSLSKSERKHYRRDVRRLQENHNVSFDVVKLEDEVSEVFDSFVAMHTTGWRKVRKLGHFADWPKADAFHRELAVTLARRGRLRLFRVTVDSRVVFYRLVYKFDERYYSILTARVSEEITDVVNLGRLCFIEVVAKAVNEGVRWIELGRGVYAHKVLLGGKDYPVRTVLVVARDAWTRFRARLFCMISGLVHIVYYKIWFLRVAPRIPVVRRPLMSLWLRSRI